MEMSYFKMSIRLDRKRYAGIATTAIGMPKLETRSLSGISWSGSVGVDKHYHFKLRDGGPSLDLLGLLNGSVSTSEISRLETRTLEGDPFFRSKRVRRLWHISHRDVSIENEVFRRRASP